MSSPEPRGGSAQTTSPTRSKRDEDKHFSLEEDEVFCKFFRISLQASSHDEQATAADSDSRIYDRLSLLACQRQGFVPEDLMHAPKQMFADMESKSRVARPKTSSSVRSRGNSESMSASRSASRHNKILDAVQESKFHAHQMRRQQFLQIAERERKGIVSLLFDHQSEVSESQEQGMRPPRMDHQQQMLHTELMNQLADSRSNNEQESAAISALLLRESDNQAHRSRVKAAVQKTKVQGEREIEKIKSRQIRSITNDLKLETQREDIYKKLQTAEQQWKEDQERRNAVLHRKSVLAARKREYKVLMLQHRQEELLTKKKSTLNERVAKREQVEQQILLQKEKEMKQRTEKSEEHMRYVKKQAELVREEEMSKCRLLQHEQDAKLALHEERRKNLQLRLETAKHLRTIESQKRHNHVNSFQSKKQTDTYDQSLAIDKRIEEANAKKLAQDVDRQNFYHSIQEEHQQSVEEAEKRRVVAQKKREMRNRELLQREYEKELLIEQLRAEAAQKQEVMKAKNHEKREQHLHNMERIKRLGEYRQKIKDAKLAEDLAHQEEQNRRKREMAQRLAQARQNVSEGKERVINKFLKLRSSPQWSQMDPKEVIEREFWRRSVKKSHSHTREGEPSSSPKREMQTKEERASTRTSSIALSRSSSSESSLSSPKSAGSQQSSTKSSGSPTSSRANTPLDEMVEKLRKVKE